MVLRVTVEPRSDLTVIRVDGRLGGAGLAEFERDCRTARRPIVLDLTHLASADDAALGLLRRLIEEGLHVLGASPYVALLLAGPAPPRRPRARRNRAAGGGPPA
jgi:hypothetical protein